MPDSYRCHPPSGRHDRKAPADLDHEASCSGLYDLLGHSDLADFAKGVERFLTRRLTKPPPPTEL